MWKARDQMSLASAPRHTRCRGEKYYCPPHGMIFFDDKLHAILDAPASMPMAIGGVLQKRGQRGAQKAGHHDKHCDDRWLFKNTGACKFQSRAFVLARSGHGYVLNYYTFSSKSKKTGLTLKELKGSVVWQARLS